MVAARQSLAPVLTKISHASGTLDDVTVVLLDLDGTLADSYPGIRGGLLHAIDAVGESHPPEDFLATIVGPPMEHTLGRLGISGKRLDAAMAAYYQYQNAQGFEDARPYAGVEKLLERWRAAGYRLATATSKSENGAMTVLRKFGWVDLFEFIGTAHNDHKHPRRGKVPVLKHVFKNMNLDPAGEPIIMVGDRHYDFEGARTMGIPSVAVTWGYGQPQEWEDATWTAHNPAELGRIIDDAAQRSN